MRINWGTGLVIGMVLFIGFIMYFVVQIVTDKEQDLVMDDYYEKAMMYQEEMDAAQNSNALDKDIYGERTAEGWLLTFPKEMDPGKISGTIHMYRPSNKKLDFEIPIDLNESRLLIPDSKLIAGRWNTTIHWQYQGKKYLFKEKILY